MGSKAEYVRSHMNDPPNSHKCHWIGCPALVPPAMWGCKRHWYMLPKALRDKIWETYVIGQEVTMTPTQAYLDAAQDVEDWIKRTYT